MNLLPGMIGVAAAGALGYWIEPWVSPTLLDMARDEPAVRDEAVAQGNSGDGGKAPGGAAEEPGSPTAGSESEPLPEPPAWMAEVTPGQLPDSVVLKREAEIPQPGLDKPMVLPAGMAVTPVRMEGQQLVVSPLGGPLEGQVPVMATDLFERFGGKPPAPEPPEMAANDPEPEPEPEPEPTLGEEEIIALMQENIKSGAIKEFGFEQVLGWTAEGEENHDGTVYQIGVAAYKAETIFGEKTIMAHALIKDGDIIKWIWPKSGMEIK